LSPIVEFPVVSWVDPCPEWIRDRAVCSLESGAVLFFPRLAFPVGTSERFLLSPCVLARGKNVCFDPRTGRLGPTHVGEAGRELLIAMLRRFVGAATTLVESVLPGYAATLRPGRTSLRPVEIARRGSSWRKDDTRLHVDSFPSSPLRGRRILRVFSNVNPAGVARTWRVGEPFECVAKKFLSSLSLRRWGSEWFLAAAHITRGRRSLYDRCMLQMHDAMKSDLAYQRQASQRVVEFPAGSTWIVFTDQVSHAVLSGQHALEQTFYLPVSGMEDSSKSPLRVLERLTWRRMV
jgi:hypothetical protein